MSMAAMMAMRANQTRRKYEPDMAGENERMRQRPAEHGDMRGKDPPMWRRDESPNMGGGGWFAWDRMMPQPHLPPDRYGQPDEMRYNGDNVTDMRTYSRQRNDMPEEQHQGKIGFGEWADRGERMTKEKAEKWIRSMETPEGKPLQPISYAEAQRIAPNYDVGGEQDLMDFWIVINMVKSDYQDVGKKYAGDAVDFYAALARDWLNDRDAVDDKLRAYKKHIVKHED